MRFGRSRRVAVCGVALASCQWISDIDDYQVTGALNESPNNDAGLRASSANTRPDAGTVTACTIASQSEDCAGGTVCIDASCVPIDSCLVDNGGCGNIINFACENRANPSKGVDCSCQPGFAGEDCLGNFDECTVNNGDCGSATNFDCEDGANPGEPVVCPCVGSFVGSGCDQLLQKECTVATQSVDCTNAIFPICKPNTLTCVQCVTDAECNGNPMGSICGDNNLCEQCSGTTGCEPGQTCIPELNTCNTTFSDIADFAVDGQFTTELASQAMGVLNFNCAACHSNGVALGNVSDILNLQTLVDTGKVVRGSRADSNLYTQMSSGSMPPPSSTQRPTAGQIEVVGQFIDGLVDDVGPCTPLAAISYDEMYEAMLQDVLEQETEDRPFIRYLGSTYLSNAGKCGRDLERQKLSLFKMINSVSLNTTITVPQAINTDETLFRIDIRDYAWNRVIDLEDDGVIDFADAWLAILNAVNVYAVEFEGNEADLLKEETQVAVPFLPINAFVKELTTGELYYALINGRRNLNDTQVDLGVDLQDSIDDGTFLRAGFSTSSVFQRERSVTRQEIGNYRGTFWLSQTFADDVGSESLYSDPLDFDFDGGEVIFSLPNGLQAYYATDNAGVGERVAEVSVNIVIDPSQDNGVVTNAASCHSCHNGGIIPFTDTVRDFVLDSGLEQFDAQTVEVVEAQYVPVAQFNTIVEEDSERHLRAVEVAGISRGSADPISRVVLQFQLGTITAELAAGELGIPLDYFMDNLNRLDPSLTPFQSGGTVDRAQFTDVYLNSICAIQAFSQNRPANCL